jgi:uncharacterized membrane protein
MEHKEVIKEESAGTRRGSIVGAGGSSAKCQHEGCTKWSLAGGNFCGEHKPAAATRRPSMGAPGSPAVLGGNSNRCTEDGCSKWRVSGSIFCTTHNTGASPVKGGLSGLKDQDARRQFVSNSKKCHHEGCTKWSASGSSFCMAHRSDEAANVDGSVETSISGTVFVGSKAKCEEEGCTKWAVSGTKHCFSHRVLSATEKKARRQSMAAMQSAPTMVHTASQKKCQGEGCTKWSIAGTTFCLEHKEVGGDSGLETSLSGGVFVGSKAKCEEEGCDKWAVSGTTHCFSHRVLSATEKKARRQSMAAMQSAPTMVHTASQKRCLGEGCTKWSIAGTTFCLEHADSAADGSPSKGGVDTSLSGGVFVGSKTKCEEEGCDKWAVSGTTHCFGHRILTATEKKARRQSMAAMQSAPTMVHTSSAQKRCLGEGCTKWSIAGTTFCLEHGRYSLVVLSCLVVFVLLSSSCCPSLVVVVFLSIFSFLAFNNACNSTITKLNNHEPQQSRTSTIITLTKLVS